MAHIYITQTGFFVPQQGILTDSVMFYGHYTNESCKAEMKTFPENYNIPLAYIFTIGVGMFITCVMLVYRFVYFFLYIVLNTFHIISLPCD